jgi:hypothetical protein
MDTFQAPRPPVAYRYVLIFGLFVVLTVPGVFIGGIGARTFGGVLGAACALLVIRALRITTAVSERRVVVRTLFRTRRVDRDRVARFAAEPARGGGAVFGGGSKRGQTLTAVLTDGETLRNDHYWAPGEPTEPTWVTAIVDDLNAALGTSAGSG